MLSRFCWSPSSSFLRFESVRAAVQNLSNCHPSLFYVARSAALTTQKAGHRAKNAYSHFSKRPRDFEFTGAVSFPEFRVSARLTWGHVPSRPVAVENFQFIRRLVSTNLIQLFFQRRKFETFTLRCPRLRRQRTAREPFGRLMRARRLGHIHDARPCWMSVLSHGLFREIHISYFVLLRTFLKPKPVHRSPPSPTRVTCAVCDTL